MNGNYDRKSLESINTREWLQNNNLSNLIDEFVINNVSIIQLIQMNVDELNEYLNNNFDINGTDKIRLRSKLHHLRIMNQHQNKPKRRKQRYYTYTDNGDHLLPLQRNNNNKKKNKQPTMIKRASFNSYLSNDNNQENKINNNNNNKQPRIYKYRNNKTFSGEIGAEMHNENENLLSVRPKLNHVKSLNDKYILSNEDEDNLDKLISHQKKLQLLINDCMNTSNSLRKSTESSIILIEKEFNSIINGIIDKKREIINKLNDIKLSRFEIINKYIIWLKEYRTISQSTMNTCMQLMNGTNTSYKIKTMVDNIINNQDIPSNVDKFNIKTIGVTFNYQSQLQSFLSSICSINDKSSSSQQIQQKQQKQNEKYIKNKDEDEEEEEEKINAVPIINDLNVSDIKHDSALIKWSGLLYDKDNKNNLINNNNIKSLGLYIDINVIDIDQQISVLQKRIKLTKNNAIYQMNLSGLECDNYYKIEFKVNNKFDKCLLNKEYKKFKTASKIKMFGGFKDKSWNRFLIKDNGKTVMLKSYDSGCILYGDYLSLSSSNKDENAWNLCSVTMKLHNISPSGFGVGFATSDFYEFDGWNTGQNSSMIVYGNGEFYTSKEFMVNNKQFDNKNGTKIFQSSFMRRNDVISIIINYKSNKLQIINVTRDKKLELNLNRNLKNIGIILWFGWTNGQYVSVLNQQFM